jgi:hypothetical protein
MTASLLRRHANRLVLAASLLVLPGVHAQEARDISSAEVDRAGLTPPDLAILDNPRFRWKHMQTDHFTLHHDQKMFATRVARMGEQFYAAVSADLPDLRDRVSPRRSHIFIFRDARDWQSVVAGRPGLESWAASFVGGNVMYLQEVGRGTSDKMGMLAHEMTHLVFNRFLPVRLPLWLNEGLAEYYGEFAYRAARGMGQGKRNAFPPPPTPSSPSRSTSSTPRRNTSSAICCGNCPATNGTPFSAACSKARTPRPPCSIPMAGPISTRLKRNSRASRANPFGTTGKQSPRRPRPLH